MLKRNHNPIDNNTKNLHTKNKAKRIRAIVIAIAIYLIAITILEEIKSPILLTHYRKSDNCFAPKIFVELECTNIIFVECMCSFIRRNSKQITIEYV